MKEPANRAEYEKRFAQNQKITGYFADTTMHVPCPFCAAPGFTDWNIYEMATTSDQPMKDEKTCKECGRSGKTLIARGLDGVRAEFVQTGGPEPADWLTPKPRRI